MSFRFRKFSVYQDSKTLHIKIFSLVNIWSPKYYYLADQIRRSSLSVVLNIAEGSSKQSDKDFNRFITIALGSTDETVACFEIALECNIINQATFDQVEKECENISKQLGGLSKKLLKKESFVRS